MSGSQEHRAAPALQRSKSSQRVDGEQLPVHSRRCQARDVSDALVVRVDNLRERQTWLLIVQCRKPYEVNQQWPKWLMERDEQGIKIKTNQYAWVP
jgi:hypothetical protein